MKKDPLAECVIAISGDFGDNRPFEKLKQWIELSGGKATRGISAKVNYLVCSRSHWKKQNSVVQAALKYKNIKVVSYDWLEDSLQRRTRCGVHAYLWSKLEQDVKIRKHHEKTEREKLLAEAPQQSTDRLHDEEGRAFHAGNELAKKDLQSENHHVYRDDTGFQYNIPLLRPDIERNRNERCSLKIYESNIHPPFLYACSATYSAPGVKPHHLILADRGSQFHIAFTAFRKFYKAKTGNDWDYRFYGRQTQDLRSFEKFDVYDVGSMDPVGDVKDLTPKEKEKGKKKKYFTYTLPDAKKGEPVGETGLMRQGVEKFGEVPKGIWLVGGEASDDEVDIEGSEDESE